MPDFRYIFEDHHTVLFVRTFIGLVLLSAAIPKLGNLRSFVEVVRNYGLLPDRAATPAASLFPLAELAIGLSLLSGSLAPWPALAANVLFMIFGGAVAINLLRGRRDVSCGCFGPHMDRDLSWWLVVRNTILAGLSLVALPLSSDYDNFGRLSVTEAAVTMLTAGALLAVWWLSAMVLAMWRSRLPDQS
jgi:Methylamine utilisation protein MauE